MTDFQNNELIDNFLSDDLLFDTKTEEEGETNSSFEDYLNNSNDIQDIDDIFNLDNNQNSFEDKLEHITQTNTTNSENIFKNTIRAKARTKYFKNNKRLGSIFTNDVLRSSPDEFRIF